MSSNFDDELIGESRRLVRPRAASVARGAAGVVSSTATGPQPAPSVVHRARPGSAACSSRARAAARRAETPAPAQGTTRAGAHTPPPPRPHPASDLSQPAPASLKTSAPSAGAARAHGRGLARASVSAGSPSVASSVSALAMGLGRDGARERLSPAAARADHRVARCFGSSEERLTALGVAARAGSPALGELEADQLRRTLPTSAIRRRTRSTLVRAASAIAGGAG